VCLQSNTHSPYPSSSRTFLNATFAVVSEIAFVSDVRALNSLISANSRQLKSVSTMIRQPRLAFTRPGVKALRIAHRPQIADGKLPERGCKLLVRATTPRLRGVIREPPLSCEFVVRKDRSQLGHRRFAHVAEGFVPRNSDLYARDGYVDLK
jgi:hypothetical protein